jgi:hypothetical protein
MGIDPGTKFHAWDFWLKKPLGIVSGALERDIAPHGVSAIALTPDSGRPQVIGCDRHVVVGAIGLFSVEWDEKSETLRGRIADTLPGLPTEIVIAVPHGRDIGEVRGGQLLDAEPGVVCQHVTLVMEGAGRWAIHCPAS